MDSLEKVFDINFRPDIDIRNISLINVEGGDKLQKEGKSIKINIDELEPEERRELLDVPREQFEIQKRVLTDEEEEDAKAIEDGYDADKEDIVEYFDGLVSERYLDILENALHLRALIEKKDLTKDEIDRRKRDIAKNYGPHGIHLSSLAIAGYFDPDGGIRDIYVDMELNEQYDRYNFQSRLEELVENRLLCVFVQNDQDEQEVTTEVRGKLAKHQEEEPVNEWLDIRGIGGDCEHIIDGVMENLEDEFIGLDYDRWMAEGDETHVRIYPNTLPKIN
jgi:hypothetical protein